MKNVLLNAKGSLSPAYIETLKLCCRYCYDWKVITATGQCFRVFFNTTVEWTVEEVNVIIDHKCNKTLNLNSNWPWNIMKIAFNQKAGSPWIGAVLKKRRTGIKKKREKKWALLHAFWKKAGNSGIPIFQMIARVLETPDISRTFKAVQEPSNSIGLVTCTPW